MNAEEQYNQTRIKCHDKAFHCYGFSYIFKTRANRLRSRVNLLKAFGVIVPATIGTIALGYGVSNWLMNTAIVIAIPVTMIQFIISICAIIYKWDEELSYCYESIPAHNNLYSRFKKLGTLPPRALKELETEFEKLELELMFRENQDDQHHIQNWETRMGMKWSLREHQHKCVECGVQPFSTKSTDCHVCGNYSFFKYQLFNL